MSPDPGVGFLEVEEDGIKTGFCECGLINFVLEIENRLSGGTVFSETVLEK